MERFQNMMNPETMSTPALVADVIYTAATDGTHTMRYHAGADAEQLLGARTTMDDAGFFGMMKGQLGLN